jgi:hypothetical protein
MSLIYLYPFKGCGPGALPPEVTNKAPFGLMSEKSNIGVDELTPK